MRAGDVVAERFEIESSAGSGGMGVVYRARDTKTDGLVALKVLAEHREGLTERFAQEVELLSGLDHPHIVGYITHGVTGEGAPYLVMPWLDGVDLQKRLEEGPLSVEETMTFARCVAGALGYLHDRGLVHRDLKPSNLFLVGGALEKVQVIDLGIARGTLPTRPLTLSGTLMGTPGFIAPELALGDRGITPAVDVFALGCVLFECLTGKRLFQGTHVMAVLAKILVEEPPRVRDLRPDVPEALDALVHRMVAKDPNLRPQDGAQLASWLEDLARAPPGSLRAPVSTSLTATERRVVTVLVVVLPAEEEPADIKTAATKLDADPFRTAAGRFGVRVQPIDARTAIVLAPEELGGADQAALLARFGRFVAEAFQGARLALATGSAVTRERMAMGEAIDRGVSIVRRAAAGGGVHVDDVSAALITSRFELRRDGDRVILADERISLDPTRPLLGQPTACVGRDRELSMLEATFAECVEGAGPKVVLMTAGAGAGKSRIAHELVRRLRSTQAPPKVLQCRGDPLHSSTPYAQIAQAVRQAVGLRERDKADVVQARLAAHVRELLQPSDVERVTHFLGEIVGAHFEDAGRVALRAARANADAMADQVRLAFAEALKAWCALHPVLLVLEDLHWGDGPSVKLIDGALRKFDAKRLFVLGLARPEVHERFPAIWQMRHPTEIRLPPLPVRASTKLVQEVMGDSASDDTVQRIVERSEGNAFYLEELIRDTAERVRRGSVRPPPPNKFPDTVIAVAQARLERLEPRVRKVLRAASIFGEVFWLEGVSALVGESLVELAPLVHALVENEMIAFSDEPRFAAREMVFRHALLRGATYATLTEEDRALGHRLAAQWLESVGEDREIIGLHWLEGGERSRATASFAAAGETRWVRGQAEAAARCAVRALLVGDGEDAQAIAARVRLLAEAISAARRIDAREVMAGVELHVPLPVDIVAAGTAQSLLRHALERPLSIVRTIDDALLASEVFARAGVALGALRDVEGAKELLREATQLAAGREEALRIVRYATAKNAYPAYDFGTAVETLSSTLLPAAPRERIEMLLILAVAVVSLEGPQALAQGLEYVSRAASLVEADGDHPTLGVQAAKARFLCFFFAGDHERAVVAAERAAELARAAGLRYEECIHLHNLGQACARLHRPELARAALASSNEIARDIGVDHMRLHNDALLAFLDEQPSRLEELANDLRDRGEGWHELQVRYFLGQLLARRGAPGAKKEVLNALELARAHKVRSFVDECEDALARIARASALSSG